MKRPVLIVVLGYIVGIIIGLYCKISIVFFYPIILIIQFILKRYNKKIRRYYSILISKTLLISFIVSSIISNLLVIYLNSKYEKVYEVKDKEEFTAVVIGTKIEKRYYNRYKIKVKESSEDTFKNMILYLNLKKDIELKYGEKISFIGTYKAPEVARNYKGFSYRNYLKTIGICGTVNADKITKKETSIVNPVARFSSKIRDYIIKILKNNIKDEEKRNLLLGILIGYDDELSNRTRDKFVNSGMSHILAVSGMHVSCLLLCLTFILKKFNIPKRCIPLILIPFIIFFIFLIGGTPSVERACIMTIFTLLASLLFRKSDIINNISVSLLIILLQNPFLLINTSLVLSFIATIGIVVTNSLIKRRRINRKETIAIAKTSFKKRILNLLLDKVKSVIYISIYVQIFILPIIVLMFNKISLLFIVSNLVISLVMSSIIIMGFISIIIHFKFIYSLLNVLLQIIVTTSNFISNLPISKIIVTTPSTISIILYYCILVILIYNDYLKTKEYKRRIERKLLKDIQNFKISILKNLKRIIIIVLIIIMLFQTINLSSRKLQIYFIDVGQGDSTLIITKNKKTILVDGGGSSSNEKFDVGEKTLLPYLLARKVRKIDYIIISHFDSDHWQGLAYIMENLKVENVIIGKQFESCENYEKFIRLVKEKNTKVHIVEAGNRINIEKNLYFDILWPDSKNVISDNSINNNSLVCKLVYKEFSVLFTGDIEEKAEEAILQKYKNNLSILNTTVLKVAHHGSKTSSTKAFLEAVKPKLALIGVGADNTFGHPSNITLENLQSISCKIYRTDENGEIMLKVNKKEKLWIDKMLN